MIFFSSIWNTFRKATKVEFGKWRSAVCQPGDGEECGSADRMSLFALEDIHPDHLPHPPSPPITSPSNHNPTLNMGKMCVCVCVGGGDAGGASLSSIS